MDATSKTVAVIISMVVLLVVIGIAAGWFGWSGSVAPASAPIPQILEAGGAI